MNIITTENWTHTQYSKEELRAIISCGASLSGELEYYLTVLDENDVELFQKGFEQLSDAVSTINLRYHQIWEFVDTNRPKKEGSCSTCVAH